MDLNRSKLPKTLNLKSEIQELMKDGTGSITKEKRWETNEMLTDDLTTGEEISITTSKQKRWVIIKSVLEPGDLFSAAMQRPEVEAIIAASFGNGTYGLVCKELNKKLMLEDGVVGQHVLIHVACAGRATIREMTPVIDTFKFGCMEAVGNIYATRDTGLMMFDEVTTEIIRSDEYSPIKIFANLKYAKESEVQLTPFQKGIDLYAAEVRAWCSHMVKAKDLIMRRDKPGMYEYPDHFEGAPQVIGVTFSCEENVIKRHTMNDYADTELHMTHSAIVVGPAECGKSSILNGFGRMFCYRYEKEIYTFGKSMDPYGGLTKNGTLEMCGAMIFVDFEMKSLQNTRISKEVGKGLFDVEEAGHVPARYNQAVLPAEKPRMFGVNSGKPIGGNPDYTEWFRKQKHLKGLVMLCKEDEDGLKAASEGDRAQARRTIIFKVTMNSWKREQINKDAKKADMHERVRAGIERERALRGR